MERRQRWLESQFRRQDESLTKIAKQLQVLQDFISLNFDSFRQYADERERVDRISHLSGRDSDGQNLQRYHSPLLHQSSNFTQSQRSSDHYHSRSHESRNVDDSTDSEYEDLDTMDPAPECDPTVGAGLNPVPIVAVDLSTERHGQYLCQQQEANSGMTECNVAAYYGIRSRNESITIPDAVMLNEEPTDLSTDKSKTLPVVCASTSGRSPLYHTNVQGSILGGILSSHIQPKIKVELKKEDEPSQCYGQVHRSRTTSTDSISKDKEYSSQSHWGAGTMTAVVSGIDGPGSVCSADDASISSEYIHHSSKHRTEIEEKSLGKSEKAMFQHFLMTETTRESDLCERGESTIGKLLTGSSSSHGFHSSGEHGAQSSSSFGDNTVAPSSTDQPRRSPATSEASTEHSSSGTATTTSTTSRKNGNSNASKQCRYCGKTFQWLHSVKTHERLHTGIKPYACKICGARFTQNGNLKVHAKTCVEKHVESYRSRNVFICSVCTEMFSDSDALMDHQKSHDRMQWTIKEKTCQLCGEVFQKRSFLLEHEKVHVQDRSFLTSLGIEAETANNNNNSSNANVANSSSENK